MRLPNRNFAAALAPLALVAALAGCGGSSGNLPPALAGPVVNGPAADYPIVIGNPYAVAGTTYTPADVWNVDEVGYAALDPEGGNAISAAHHTLPLPSYAEVTSLETGKTILVRVERRGPMTGTETIALSQGAAAQLGIRAGAPVRVRRVNPQEPERAALRAGETVPERMETPMSLVEVLKLKLPQPGGTASLAQVPAPREDQAAPEKKTEEMPVAPLLTANDSPSPVTEPTPVVEPHAKVEPKTESQPKVESKPPAPKPAAAVVTAKGSFMVQAGAFSTQERADRVAKALGGTVSKSGSLYRVRTGPFTSRQAAEASLAKVKAAGYSDARIYSGG